MSCPPEVVRPAGDETGAASPTRFLTRSRSTGPVIYAGCGQGVLVSLRCWSGMFARRSGVPLARQRLTGEGDDVAPLYPSHRRGREPPGDLALEHPSTNPCFLELRRTCR